MIGEIIRKWRQENGISQQALAEMCGVHRTLIARYETGKIEPNMSTLAKLSDAMHIPVSAFFGK